MCPSPGRCSRVIGRCLLHRRAVYHISLCADVRDNFNMGLRLNIGGSSSFVCLGLHMFHYPLYLNLPGEPGTRCTLVFSPQESPSERTGALRNPLISTKHTSKTPNCGERGCTRLHTYMETCCTGPPFVLRGIRHQTVAY